MITRLILHKFEAKSDLSPVLGLLDDKQEGWRSDSIFIPKDNFWSLAVPQYWPRFFHTQDCNSWAVRSVKYLLNNFVLWQSAVVTKINTCAEGQVEGLGTNYVLQILELVWWHRIDFTGDLTHCKSKGTKSSP